MRRAVVTSCAEPNGRNQGECWDCETPAKCRDKTGDTTKELLSKAGAINHREESGGKAGDQPRSTLFDKSSSPRSLRSFFLHAHTLSDLMEVCSICADVDNQEVLNSCLFIICRRTII